MIRFDARKHPVVKKIWAERIKVMYYSKRKSIGIGTLQKLKDKGIQYVSVEFHYFKDGSNPLYKTGAKIHLLDMFEN